MNPGKAIEKLMAEKGVSALDMARALDVRASDIDDLLQGDSPCASTLAQLPGELAVSERFINALYAAPSEDRDIALGAVLAARQRAA